MATFESTASGTLAILSVSGRLDPSADKDLNAALAALAADHPHSSLLVDLSGVDYMASAGFRELFLAGRKLGRAGCTLGVCCLQGEVRRIFELAKFETAYPVYATRDEAVEALTKPASA